MQGQTSEDPCVGSTSQPRNLNPRHEVDPCKQTLFSNKIAAMKFGRDLHQHRVPAWSDSYVNYERLKLLIRTGSEKGSFDNPHTSYSLPTLSAWELRGNCGVSSPLS